jgi:hypothetical protein
LTLVDLCALIRRNISAHVSGMMPSSAPKPTIEYDLPEPV